MLVLSRKVNEDIVIGHDITVKVLRVRGNKVTLGIGAPEAMKIVRTELKLRPGPSPRPSPRSTEERE